MTQRDDDITGMLWMVILSSWFLDLNHITWLLDAFKRTVQLVAS